MTLASAAAFLKEEAVGWRQILRSLDCHALEAGLGFVGSEETP